jgi:hypothetical protein
VEGEDEQDQHILRLDIAVEEAVLVHEGHALEDLVHDVADLRLREVLVSVLHELVEIAVHVFEHEEQLIVLADHFLELHNVWMI